MPCRRAGRSTGQEEDAYEVTTRAFLPFLVLAVLYLICVRRTNILLNRTEKKLHIQVEISQLKLKLFDGMVRLVLNACMCSIFSTVIKRLMRFRMKTPF